MVRCKKTSYGTKAFAEADIVRFSKSNREKNPKSCYKCKKCGLWHLTSQESHAETVKVQAMVIETQKKQIAELIKKLNSVDHGIRQGIMQSDIVIRYKGIIKKNNSEIKKLRKTISELAGKITVT